MNSTEVDTGLITETNGVTRNGHAGSKEPAGKTIFSPFNDRSFKDHVHVPEQSLTPLQKALITFKIRGFSDAAIAERLSITETDVVPQLHAGYERLNVAPEEYDAETALTQAGLYGVNTKQLPISEFAQDFSLENGTLLDESQHEVWVQNIDDNGRHSGLPDIAQRLHKTEAEILTIEDRSYPVLGATTHAQAAIFYLAYTRDQSLSEAERRVRDQSLRVYLSSHDIAKELYLSVNTVKTHMRSIYSKLGISHRYDLIDFYRSSSENTFDLLRHDTDQELAGDQFYEIKSGPLTSAEIIVLQQMLLGYKNEKIASNLGISINTVKTHIVSVYQKVLVTGRMGYANYQMLMKAYHNAVNGGDKGLRRIPINSTGVVYELKSG